MRAYHSLSEIQTDLKAGKISCTALVHFYLKRIEEKKHLNCFLEVFAKSALAKAEELDKKRISSPLGKLGGAVIADRKSTRLNSSHIQKSRMPSSA